MESRSIVKKVCQVSAMVLALAVSAVPARAQVIDFEGAAGPCYVAQGYAGMNWFGPGNTTTGWANAVGSCGSQIFGASILQPISGANNIWSNGGSALAMSRVNASAFNFSSVWMACAFGSCSRGVTQTVRGFLLGTEIFTSTVPVTATMAQYNFNFAGVDEVRWDAFQPSIANLLIDDIAVSPTTTVPEPGSFALIAAGLAALVVVGKRRRTR